MSSENQMGLADLTNDRPASSYQPDMYWLSETNWDLTQEMKWVEQSPGTLFSIYLEMGYPVIHN